MRAHPARPHAECPKFSFVSVGCAAAGATLSTMILGLTCASLASARCACPAARTVEEQHTRLADEREADRQPLGLAAADALGKRVSHEDVAAALQPQRRDDTLHRRALDSLPRRQRSAICAASALRKQASEHDCPGARVRAAFARVRAAVRAHIARLPLPHHVSLGAKSHRSAARRTFARLSGAACLLARRDIIASLRTRVSSHLQSGRGAARTLLSSALRLSSAV